jgi:rhamnosyltransferase
MNFSDFIKEVLFVIVLYKKKPEESLALKVLHQNLLPEHILVFLYDNSPEPTVTNLVNTIYLHDPFNSGVSKAYNQACKLATQQNRKWLLLLDQDTALDIKLIEQLRLAVSEHNNSVAFAPVLKDKKGIVSPFRWSLGKGRRITLLRSKLPLKKYRFANSGLLVQTNAFRNAGGYEESIYLDFSDIAFGEKLKKITDHFVVVEICLEHQFSGSTVVLENEAISRFTHFCAGALSMGKIFGSRYIYVVRVLLRALRLMVLYKNTVFVKMFLNSVKNY